MSSPVTSPSALPAGPATTASYSNSLASLRGLAAAVVVVYHALLVFQVGDHGAPHRATFDLSDPPLAVLHALMGVFNGPNAVILFFVLSGTVLALSIERAGAITGRTFVGYCIRRLFRIVPLLAFVALLTAGMHLFLAPQPDIPAGTAWMNNYFRHDPTLGELALNAIGWSNSLNSPTWTIRVEILASLVFPVLFVLRSSGAMIAVTLAALAALALVPLGDVRFHIFLISFYLGALVPLCGARIGDMLGRLNVPQALLVIVVLMAWAAAVGRLYKPWIHVEPVRVLLVSPAVALLVAVVYRGVLERRFSTRALTFLGEISYSTYLIHFGVIFTMLYAVAPHLPGSLSPLEALGSNLLLSVLALALTIPIAFLTYTFVEKPFQQLGRRLAHTWGHSR